MNIEFEHLQDIDLNQNSEERPFIQLEIPDYTEYYNQEEESKEEEKELKRVIIIDL